MSLSPPSITATVATIDAPSFNLTKLITQTTDALLFDHPTVPLQHRAAQIYLALAVAFKRVGLMHVADAPRLVVGTPAGPFAVSRLVCLTRPGSPSRPAPPYKVNKGRKRGRRWYLPNQPNGSQKKMRSLTSQTIACQLCLPSLQASSNDADVYNMCEVDAGTTGAGGESAVPGFGSAAPDSGGPAAIPAPSGSRPALVGPAGPPGSAAEPAAAVNSPQRQQPKQERTRSAELLLQMLHERRLELANLVPARSPLELKLSLKLELKQSDSADVGTGVVGGAAGAAVAGQGPHAQVSGPRGSGGADFGDLSRPPGPGQNTDPVQRLAWSIQQIDHLDVQFTSLSIATNWAYYKVGMAYAAFGQVSARA